MGTQESSPSDDMPAESGADNDDPPRSKRSTPDTTHSAVSADAGPPDAGAQPSAGPDRTHVAASRDGVVPASSSIDLPDPDAATAKPTADTNTEVSPAGDEPLAPDGRPSSSTKPHARFTEPARQKPQRYNRGHSKKWPTTPLDPISPYTTAGRPRRRRSEWPVLLFALVVAAIVMGACCVAGFAIFRSYGLG